jgi:hypothetical protein
MPALRDRVDILHPVTRTDSYTEATVPDWTQDPTETTGVRATVQPVVSTEAQVTATTVVSSWDCWMPADTEVDTTDRVRWDDGTGPAVYTIDGEVERWKSGRRVRRIHFTLKRVT